MSLLKNQVIKILKKGGIGVMPTDTIYGLVGLALSPKTVLRIYRVRHRNAKKPMIILLGSLAQLKLFGVKIDPRTRVLLKKLWPGRVSIILPCKNQKFFYLHRGKKTLAFRLPKVESLRELLLKTGPLVAPSANYEGEKPAFTIKEAKKYFGSKIDFYFNGGLKTGKPSTLVAIDNGRIIVKRQGSAGIFFEARADV